MKLSTFRRKVRKAWKQLGPTATSREIADEINAQEHSVSKAMVAIESFGGAYLPFTPKRGLTPNQPKSHE